MVRGSFEFCRREGGGQPEEGRGDLFSGATRKKKRIFVHWRG